MIKVMIVDDQELIRHSLKIILGVNNDMEVVGMAADGAETLQKLKELSPEERPDVILMDMNIKVIALTTFDDEEFVFGALKSGASGYLLKGSSLEELSGAIRTVYTGGAMLNPNVASTVIRQFSTMAKNIVNPEITDLNTNEITRSEWYIIQAVARGMSNKEIAESLWLSQGTVRNSISSILNKLHLRDRTQLAIWAVQTGIVNKDLFDS